MTCTVRLCGKSKTFDITAKTPKTKGGHCMKRKDFYIEYYYRTNRAFSDKMVWGKEERQEAWRKGQQFISKLERKVFIVTQYLSLLLCWIPMCFERGLWVTVPIAFFCFLLQSVITDFSFIKIEWLYSIYRQNNAYCSALHDIFLGNFGNFLAQLKRETKTEVTGYYLKRGGKFYGKYCAVCRSKDKKIVVTFKRNCVVVVINEKAFVIKEVLLTKEHLITEIAAIINLNK